MDDLIHQVPPTDRPTVTHIHTSENKGASKLQWNSGQPPGTLCYTQHTPLLPTSLFTGSTGIDFLPALARLIGGEGGGHGRRDRIWGGEGGGELSLPWHRYAKGCVGRPGCGPLAQAPSS